MSDTHVHLNEQQVIDFLNESDGTAKSGVDSSHAAICVKMGECSRCCDFFDLVEQKFDNHEYRDNEAAANTEPLLVSPGPMNGREALSEVCS